MKEKRKQFEFTLVTVAPVHIGSGQKYSNKEYIFENHKFYFPDLLTLYNQLQKRGPHVVSDFEDYLSSSGNYGSNRLTLGKYLTLQKIDYRTLPGRIVDAPAIESLSGQRRGFEVRPFIKDAFDNPYIPGTSLKGAIRTILCNEVFHSDNKEDIPWGARKGVEFNDLFHNIRVSDSQPLTNPDSLIMIQKIDQNKEKDKTNDLPLYREAIRPGTKVTFVITCVGEKAIQLIESLQKHSLQHYDRMKEFFYNDFSAKYSQYLGKPFSQYGVLYLGGGTGWVTKTIFNSKNISIRSARNPKMKMTGKGVLKLTRHQYTTTSIKFVRGGNPGSIGYFEMGRCIFSIKVI